MGPRIFKKMLALLSGCPKTTVIPARRKIRLECLEDRALLAASDLLAATVGDTLYSDSAIVGDANTDVVSNEVVWNLADYNYSEYSVEGVQDAQVALYGIANGEKTELATTTGTTLKIVGDDAKAETIAVDASTAATLKTFEYDGGTEKNDVVIVRGTENADTFVLSSLSSSGDSSDDSSDSRHGRWDHWDHGRKGSEKSSDDVSVVSLADGEDEGATFSFKDVNTLTVDGNGGADVFQVESLATDVSLVSDGNDALDFSGAETGSSNSSRHGWDDWGWDDWGWDDWSWGHGRQGKVDGVTIDLSSSDWQEVAQKWNGRLRLEGDFVSFVGSAKNDKVVGSNVSITENAGKNVVELTGGDNKVELKSDGNSVSASGSGSNDITVVGNNSKINLTQTESTAKNNVVVTGNRNTTRGGSAADVIAVSGDRNNVDAGDGDDVIIVSGASNKAKGAAGNDVIWAVNSSGSGKYSGGAGDDIVFGGSGNDWIFGGDGRDILFGSTGWDEIDGGRGADLLVANRTDKTTDLESWDDAKRDAFLASLRENWIENEDMDATLELIGSSCVADDSGDCIWSGRNDEDRVLLSSSERDREWRGQSWDWWF